MQPSKDLQNCISYSVFSKPKSFNYLIFCLAILCFFPTFTGFFSLGLFFFWDRVTLEIEFKRFFLYEMTLLSASFDFWKDQKFMA